MGESRRDWLETLGRGLYSWTLLGAGVAMLAAAALMPTAREVAQLRWQVGLVHVQAERLAVAEGRYAQVLAAMESHDPMLMDRLAFHHQRAMPSGDVEVVSDNGVPGVGYGGRGVSMPGGMGSTSLSTKNLIEQWIEPRLPRIGVDYPAFAVAETRLERLMHSRGRFGVAALGVVCVVIGLWLPQWRRDAA